MYLHSRVNKLEQQSNLLVNILAKNEVSAEWRDNMRSKIKSMDKQDLIRLLELLKKRRDYNDRTEAEEAELEIIYNKYGIKGQTDFLLEREQT